MHFPLKALHKPYLCARCRQMAEMIYTTYAPRSHISLSTSTISEGFAVILTRQAPSPSPTECRPAPTRYPQPRRLIPHAHQQRFPRTQLAHLKGTIARQPRQSEQLKSRIQTPRSKNILNSATMPRRECLTGVWSGRKPSSPMLF